ncbi:hypothetical protein MLD38_034541 [Melastoma candidum]|uniref:Uncharacterized protein n=1 Tax=Melastoma candidum TaxID=119954 RepID=A0ACB9MBL2_9MYRT|nr:hypothetical protein MLD38_034541 [Melastoma candidum]
MNMKRFSASPDSSDVRASACPEEEPPPKRKQIYSKEFQEMLDKLDHEELGEDDADSEDVGLMGFGGCGEKKRRLNVDQVKALERSFEKENKLEPERKSRLAEELGLQPRQVAIWFQNRRARWKTKQLERDYGVLKNDYDSLRADYDFLDQENKSLLSQLMELKTKPKQQDRAAENNPDNDFHVPVEEECPASGSVVVVVKPQFGYGSEMDASSNIDDCSDALIKEETLEEEGEEPNPTKTATDTVMPMPSPASVSYLNQNNTSTASSGSSCTTSMFSWFQGWDSRGPTSGTTGKAAYTHAYPRANVEEQHHGWLNFFSVDQAPTLHCYFTEGDEK